MILKSVVISSSFVKTMFPSSIVARAFKNEFNIVTYSGIRDKLLDQWTFNLITKMLI
jgi:hypothetical protein